MVARVPAKVGKGLRDLGEHVRTWRKLNGLTQQMLAERANISAQTVRAIESGSRGVSVENVLRVLWVLGLIDPVVAAIDPLEHPVGRLRAEQNLPTRVHRPRSL